MTPKNEQEEQTGEGEVRVLSLGHAPEEAGGDKRRRVPGGSQLGIRVIRMEQALPRAPCGLGVPTSPIPLGSRSFLGHKVKTRSKECFSQETLGWVGSVL